jgi:hypothetical protein
VVFIVKNGMCGWINVAIKVNAPSLCRAAKRFLDLLNTSDDGVSLEVWLWKAPFNHTGDVFRTATHPLGTGDNIIENPTRRVLCISYCGIELLAAWGTVTLNKRVQIMHQTQDERLRRKRTTLYGGHQILDVMCNFAYTVTNLCIARLGGKANPFDA